MDIHHSQLAVSYPQASENHLCGESHLSLSTVLVSPDILPVIAC
jgi:hypothetical protein